MVIPLQIRLVLYSREGLHIAFEIAY